MPPPRPAERLRALRWEAKEDIVRLQRWVRISRVIAAREKMSAGVWDVGGVEEEDHLSWRGCGFGEVEGIETDVVEGEEGEEKGMLEEVDAEDEEVMDGDEMMFLAALDQIALRWDLSCFCGGLWVVSL